MKKVLLVEDDPFLVDIYKNKLEESHYEVEAVGDGEKAIEKIKEIKPDVVLLDIILPSMDGWEILRIIRNNPDTKDLKVIMLSNLGQKEEVEKGVDLGATKYLIKAHFTPSEVVKEINELLN
ncbi:MAG: Two component transcriptional regulator, winged helix family [Parcubacteria group bacterium GW2011_GWC1_38_6]|nr:MAG: Two component transcriptional regulator, winged helix family [Parcubacteria group bacterium GW2011_GWC1_38_6]